MKTLRATGTHVVIIPSEGKTDDDGRPISDGGIYLGREVNYPTGVVVSIGAQAAQILPELQVGQTVVYQRMLQSVLTLDGVGLEVVNVAESCPHCKAQIHKGGIVGLVEPGTADEKPTRSEAI